MQLKPAFASSIAFAFAASTVALSTPVLAAPQANGIQVKTIDSTVPPVSRDKVEIVFVLDTTGSMGGLIEGAKKKIWFIANEVLRNERKPSLKVGLVAYRDKGDAYVTKALPLTTDLDQVYSTLMGYRVGGGGDSPEHVNAGLDAAVTKQPWSQGNDVLKMVFLVGDAPPHMDYGDDRKHTEISKDAVANNIFVHTIQCGTDRATTAAWKRIARNSEGRYAAIKQTGGVVARSTPFDEELGRLARDLDGTNVDIGDHRVARARTRSVASGYASKAPASVAAERALVKSKVRLEAKDDLVALYEKGGAKAVEDLDEEALPTTMAKKPKKMRVKQVKELAKKRKVLRTKIQTLEKKRAAYLAKTEKAEPKTGFDAEVADMISTSMH